MQTEIVVDMIRSTPKLLEWVRYNIDHAIEKYAEAAEDEPGMADSPMESWRFVVAGTAAEFLEDDWRWDDIIELRQEAPADVGGELLIVGLRDLLRGIRWDEVCVALCADLTEADRASGAL